MSKKVGVIDYGDSGNVFNIVMAAKKAGASAGIIAGVDDFSNYDKLILPGVGSFPGAMATIRQNGMEDCLKEAIRQKPTLGICLGMQILCKVGFEFEETKGLGLIDAEVKSIECKGKVPRMGYGRIETVRESTLFKGVKLEDEFYFMHSYEVVNYTELTALTTFAGHRYVCAYEQGHIYGVQFHPEKSRDPGICILKNFIEQ